MKVRKEKEILINKLNTTHKEQLYKELKDKCYTVGDIDDVSVFGLDGFDDVEVYTKYLDFELDDEAINAIELLYNSNNMLVEVYDGETQAIMDIEIDGDEVRIVDTEVHMKFFTEDVLRETLALIASVQTDNVEYRLNEAGKIATNHSANIYGFFYDELMTDKEFADTMYSIETELQDKADDIPCDQEIIVIANYYNVKPMDDLIESIDYDTNSVFIMDYDYQDSKNREFIKDNMENINIIPYKTFSK